MKKVSSNIEKNLKQQIIFCILITFCFSACSLREAPKWKAERHNEIHLIANKQLPAEPIYNPVRWVRPPEVTPSRKPDYKPSNKAVTLIYSFSVKDSTLNNTSLSLANALGYRSYCSSLIAEQVFSMELVGSIDEIATNISKKAGIKVVVDHDNKEVRFLIKDALVPQFAER